MTGPSFIDQVREAVLAARTVYAGTPHDATVAEIQARLDGPLRVAIAGRIKAGKSTLLNALIGDELAPTDAGECTRFVWWFHDGITYRAIAHLRDGRSVPTRFSRDAGAIQVDLGGIAPTDIERLEVEWPSQALRTMSLIDTPGIASATAALADAAQDFLEPDDERAAPADAVVYLMRHVHSADVRFLEAFHDDEYAHASPLNTIAVLSRADELGVARLDAMESAERVAERYRQDRKLRRLCQAVVPVAGLLAQAAATLREQEFRLVVRLAALPQAELDDLLLSVDRFGTWPSPVPAGERAALLRRLGLYGVRRACALVGDGTVATASELSASLLRASRLDDLRSLLAAQFTARRDLLKGRAVLLALDSLVQRHPVPGSEVVDIAVERIQSSAHELVEVRLLNALRSGAVVLRDADLAEAERLLGANGAAGWARLGLAPDADAATTSAALSAALARWHRRAENPLASSAVSQAARVLVRTCEGLAAQVAAIADT